MNFKNLNFFGILLARPSEDLYSVTEKPNSPQPSSVLSENGHSEPSFPVNHSEKEESTATSSANMEVDHVEGIKKESAKVDKEEGGDREGMYSKNSFSLMTWHVGSFRPQNRAYPIKTGIRPISNREICGRRFGLRAYTKSKIGSAKFRPKKLSRRKFLALQLFFGGKKKL